MKKSSIMAGVLALILFVSVQMGTPGSVLAQKHRGGHNGKGFLNGLTSEQREAIHDRIAEMRDQGATREEIRAAVNEMLEGYGIEAPDHRSGPAGFGHPWGGFWADLTQEQREAAQRKIEEMRDQGATRDEIRAAVAEMLEGYGVELPENWRLPGGHRGFGPGGFWEDLTEEQRQAVRDKRQEMRDQGATREEIKAAVAEMLEDYGVELPKKGLGWHGPRGLGHRGECFGVDLTDEQRKAVQEKIREMRSQDASRQEIHTAVAGMFETYGIELPDFFGQLTQDQRKVVRKKIGEMKREGASCEEIRAAVAEMLQQYGFDLPERSETTSSETAPGQLDIEARSYPNPFNPETQIAYSLSVSENVRVRIYNVSGQLIRTYDMGYQPAGDYSVRWDGRNEEGDPAASGVYLYRIEAGPHQVTDRMVLLK